MADKIVSAKVTTRVTHVAWPLGPARENGPHLADLRAFVAACDGLPDEQRVFITQEDLRENGRRNVTFLVVHEEPIVDSEVAR